MLVVRQAWEMHIVRKSRTMSMNLRALRKRIVSQCLRNPVSGMLLNSLNRPVHRLKRQTLAMKERKVRGIHSKAE